MTISAIVDERKDFNDGGAVYVVVLPAYGNEKVDDESGESLISFPRWMSSWIWPETTLKLAMNWAERLSYPVILEIMHDWDDEERAQLEKENYLSGKDIVREEN